MTQTCRSRSAADRRSRPRAPARARRAGADAQLRAARAGGGEAEEDAGERAISRQRGAAAQEQNREYAKRSYKKLKLAEYADEADEDDGLPAAEAFGRRIGGKARPAGGTMEKAMLGGGCGHEFDFRTLGAAHEFQRRTLRCKS